MEIKIKVEADDNKETYLLFTNEHLNTLDFVDVVLVKGGEIIEDMTVNLTSLLATIEAFITIRKCSDQ